MKNDKKTGSYYTPLELIQFMITYLEKEQQDFTDVLEPSAGDGRFLSFLLPRAGYVKAVEISGEKTDRIKEKYREPGLQVECCNFLDYISESHQKYSLIIGNPPYINRQLMDKEDREKAVRLCEEENLPKNVMQNMWVAFILGAVRLLSRGGSIFFVLPMEFLQVQYAEKLRIYLEERFNTIHVISFRESVFKDIEQDICLVFLTSKDDRLPHILYEIYETPYSNKPCHTNLIKKNKPLKKWSNAVLEDEEISLLRISEDWYEKVNRMGDIAPGIVTGGNKYFVLTRAQVEKYDCMSFTLPIVLKPSYIPKKTVEIDDSVIREIEEHGQPAFLLNLSEYGNISALPERLWKYLQWAGEEKVQGTVLRERFKCANRSPWYGVPIVKRGDVIFFKRYDVLPKVFVNTAGIHTADTGYHIRLKQGYDAESLVFCFFNSMTLAQCEFNGRFYGGGVSELVPSEFKNIVVPYREIGQNDIMKLKAMFKNGSTETAIIDFVNSKTIAEDLTDEQVEEFEKIRLKLIRRRIDLI